MGFSEMPLIAARNQ